jgi:pimeloyl-ACP methyl ester carboxylesterase
MDSLAQIQEGFVNVENGRLFYQKQGEGQPILFLHGLCLDHRMWDDQIHFFAPQFTCITVDLRGFGKSTVPSAPYSFHEDLRILLDSLHIAEPVTIVALSMGGKAAINFTLTYPVRVKTLILVDAAVDGYPFKDFVLKPIYNVASDKGVDSANQLFLENPIFACSRKNEKVFAEVRDMVLSYSGWQWTHQNPMKYLTPVAIEQLDRIETPTLIVTGENDIADFQDIAQLLHKKIKQSTIQTIEHAGHMCNMENSRAFNDLVLKFIKGQRR